MTCKVKVTTYQNEQAILIPQELVETDQKNKKRKYVLVLDELEDEPMRRKVRLGRRKGKLVEVVKGLDAGEKLLKPAKDEDKEPTKDRDKDKEPAKDKDKDKDKEPAQDKE